MKFIYLPLFILIFSISTSCSKYNDFLPIPLESEIVIKINTSELGQKLFLEKAKDFSFDDLLSWGKNDSILKGTLWEKIINKPGKAGIDYLEPIYLFQYKKEKFILAAINNEKEFTELIKESKGAINPIEGGFSSTHLSYCSIAWNKKLVIFQIDGNNKSLVEFIKLRKENTIFSRDDFQKSSKLSDDIVCFLQPGKLITDGSLLQELKLLTDNSSIIRVNFEKGGIQVSADSIIHPESEKLFSKLQSKSLLRIEEPNSLASIYFNIDPKILTRLSDSSFIKMGINKEILLSGLTGEFYGVISKFNSGSKTYTTYEMDDDFNKVEITDTVFYNYPTFDILIPFNNHTDGKAILNSLTKSGYLSKKQNYYSYNLLNSPVHLMVNDNNLIISDSIPTIKLSKKAPSNFSSYCFYIRIKPNKWNLVFLSDINKSEIQELIIIGIKQNEMNIHFQGNIIFKEKEKNGLFSLIDMLKGSYSEIPAL